MRTIGIVTVARSDYSIFLPVLRKIQSDRDLALRLIVSGTHLSPEFGLTVRAIEADSFEISDRVEVILSADTPGSIAKSMGLGLIGFAQAFARLRPDILVVLGDRFEMHSAALAALPFRIPVAHLHGGEITQGAIDDALRHSITKLSHLHFVATAEYARRVVQLGEEPWRVIVSGAPGLDNLNSVELLDRHELHGRYGVCLETRPLLVTFHPVTLEYEQTEWQTGELLAALEICGMPVVFTLPNADTSGRVIITMIKEFAQRHRSAQIVASLGTQGYLSLMATSAAMVGNSSSGIIEAPSLKLPVVNIGSRQHGRVKAANVIDVGYGRNDIVEGIHEALEPGFRDSLSHLVNPYKCILGHASDIIVESLKSVGLGSRLVTKRFVDVASGVLSGGGLSAGTDAAR